MMEVLVYSIIFLYGIFIGSFLNVCIWRIPEKHSIVSVESHCMSCNTLLKWYDLIPIISYVVLRGRCRRCKAKISLQYPMVELLNGVLYVLIFFIYGWGTLPNILLNIAYALVVSALIVLSIIDFRTQIIPFGINVFIFIMGLSVMIIKYFCFGNNIGVVTDHIIGFFVVSLFLLILYTVTRGRGIGGGDIKLMAAAGLVLGWQLTLLAFLVGCVLASIIHPLRMKVSRVNSVLAFGPYLSGGIAVAILYGERMMNWYLHTFFI